MLEAHPKVPLADLTHDILFELTDIPMDVAEHYVRRAAIELARNANVLRRRREICVQDGVSNYLLESDDETDLVAVMSVTLMGECGSFSRPVARFNQRPTEGGYGYRTWMEGSEINFLPANGGDRYDVQFSVAPTIDACSIDSLYATELYTALVTQALALAYALPGKPWSDPRRSLELKTDAHVLVQRAAVDRLTGGQCGLIRAKRPRVL